MELEYCAAKDEVLQSGGGLDPGEGDCEIGAEDSMGANAALDPGEANKVKVEVTCVDEVVKEIRVAQVKVERLYVFQVKVEELANKELANKELANKEVQWLNIEVL